MSVDAVLVKILVGDWEPAILGAAVVCVLDL
jgi:hypothetical protein